MINTNPSTVLTEYDYLENDAPAALFFDLGMVLFQFDWQIAVPRFAAHNHGDTDKVVEFLLHPLHHDFEKGLLTPHEFFAQAQTLMGFEGTYEQFKAYWTEIFTPIAATISHIPLLAARYPLYVVSNTNVLHTDYLTARDDIFRFFTQRFYSFDLGVRKPDALFYELALEHSGVTPSRALLIDDRADNIAGARALGMQTLHVPTPEQAQPKLSLLLDYP